MGLRSAILIGAVVACIAVGPMAKATNVYAYGTVSIMVDTGAKDYGSHSQYVSSITVVANVRDNWACGAPFEAWAGNVWYASRYACNSTTFYIQRWIPSGSGVCGRVTWVPVSNGKRYDAQSATNCISIRV